MPDTITRREAKANGLAIVKFRPRSKTGVHDMEALIVKHGLVREYLHRGYSPETVKSLFGCDDEFIELSTAHLTREELKAERQRLARDLSDEGVSYIQIGEIFGVGKSTIERWLKAEAGD